MHGGKDYDCIYVYTQRGGRAGATTTTSTNRNQRAIFVVDNGHVSRASSPPRAVETGTKTTSKQVGLTRGLLELGWQVPAAAQWRQ